MNTGKTCAEDGKRRQAELAARFFVKTLRLPSKQKRYAFPLPRTSVSPSQSTEYY